MTLTYGLRAVVGDLIDAVRDVADRVDAADVRVTLERCQQRLYELPVTEDDPDGEARC